jgi:hypothetical protein
MTAALTLLTGAVWASGASAMTAPPVVVASNTASYPAVSSAATGAFGLGFHGFTMPYLSTAGASTGLRLGSTPSGPLTQFEFSAGPNWDVYGAPLPLSAGQWSNYLAGSSIGAAADVPLGGHMSLQLGHTEMTPAPMSADLPALSRDLALRLGTSLRNLGTTSASMNWDFANWGALGLSASHGNDNGALLGTVSGPLGAAGLAESSSLGISARVGFGEGWVTTLAYNEGVTQLDLSRTGLASNPSPMQSQAYGIAVAKQGLFGDDALGIALSHPLQMFNPASLAGVGANFSASNVQAQESDVALGYVTTFLDGSLALQANAAYQVNAAGARGQNAVAGVARAKLNF